MQLVQHRSFASTLLITLLVVSFCLPGLLHAQARRPSTFPMPSVTGLTVEQANERVLEAGREQARLLLDDGELDAPVLRAAPGGPVVRGM